MGFKMALRRKNMIFLLLFQALRHLGQHGRMSEEPVLDVDELQDQLWGVRQQMH